MGIMGIPSNPSSGTKLRSALDEARQRIEAYEDFLEPMQKKPQPVEVEAMFLVVFFQLKNGKTTRWLYTMETTKKTLIIIINHYIYIHCTGNIW